MRRNFFFAAIAVAMLSLLFLDTREHGAGAADFVDVTVRIKCVLQIENPDTFATDGNGDYFGSVKIEDHDFAIPDSAGPLGKGPIEDDEFCPDWRFTRNVDRTGPVDIVIRLWDSDDGFAGAKDLMDISPKDNDVELNIRLNGLSGTWDVSESDVQGFVAEGDGDHGVPGANDGRRARIQFEIFLGSNPDGDGDGISDAIENMGVRKSDNSLLFDLKSRGADPCRPTVMVWIDYMNGAADGHSHKPKPGAIQEVVDAFDKASHVPGNVVPCPYISAQAHKTTGLDFIYFEGKPIAEAPVMTDGDPGFVAARTANLPPELRPYAHYAIFVHDSKAGSSQSGHCCDGRDFVVSLGSWRNICVDGSGMPKALNTTAQTDDVVVGTSIDVGTNRVCDTTAAGGDAQILPVGRNCVGPGPNAALDSTRQGDDITVGTSIAVGPDLTCNSAAAPDDVQIMPVGGGPTDARAGTIRDQSGSIMHELGHALGLGHGGLNALNNSADTVNNKPNYLSVMNYSFDPGGIPRGVTPPGASAPPTVIDYSRVALPAGQRLDESKLKESEGITGQFPGTLTDWTRWTNSLTNAGGALRCTGGICWNSAAGAIDWDQSGTIDDGSVGCGDTPPTNNCVSLDINSDDDSSPPSPQTVLIGREDWQSLQYRGADAPTAGGSGASHPTTSDTDFPAALNAERQFLAFFDPDLAATKTVDKADAQGGDELTYTVKVKNIGPGPAANVAVTDTFPSGQPKTSESQLLGSISPEVEQTATFKLVIDCATADGTVLTNNATASGTDLGGGAENNLANNTSTASTTVHSPKLKATKTASGTGRAGEAITYTVVVTNTGSASATNVSVKDVLPIDVYYSKALDLGTGPKPDTITKEANGKTTLTWTNLGTLAASGSRTLVYTARPSLLFLGGQSIANAVEVTYQNSSNCTFAPERTSASSTITVVPPSRDSQGLGFWRSHPELETAESLARIQATDVRFDGADGTTSDGALSLTEAQAVLVPGGNMDKVLEEQLLGTYLNLATRRINAGTLINSRTADRLGLNNVRDAALYAGGTLELPVNSANRARYSDATRVLDEINTNRSEVY
jgi:uncharacterized repeat protein (TIGR01451 family)